MALTFLSAVPRVHPGGGAEGRAEPGERILACGQLAAGPARVAVAPGCAGARVAVPLSEGFRST